MSSTMLIENEKTSFKDLFIFESIKPQHTKFGINSEFDDGGIFKINKIYATTSKYKSSLYTVIINDDVVGFHLSEWKEKYNEFNYVDFILDSEQMYNLSSNNALSIFSYVFFIIEYMINTYNLKIIKFEGENDKLKNLYSKLVKNKLFIKEFENLGFSYSFDGIYHTFKKEIK